MTAVRLLSRLRGLLRDGVARIAHDRPSPRAFPAVRAAPPVPVAADTAATAAAVRQPLSAPDLHQLEAEARYHRDRLALYRARVHSARPTSQIRLRELQRTSAAADARLCHARRP